jgi:hypothetical protein
MMNLLPLLGLKQLLQPSLSTSYHIPAPTGKGQGSTEALLYTLVTCWTLLSRCTELFHVKKTV